MVATFTPPAVLRVHVATSGANVGGGAVVGVGVGLGVGGRRRLRRRSGRRLRRRGGGGLLGGLLRRLGRGRWAAVDGAGLSTASGGRTRKTFGEPLRSWRVTALLRASISAGALQRREEGRLLGHHVVGAGDPRRGQLADPDHAAVRAVGAAELVAAGEPGDVADPEHDVQLGAGQDGDDRSRGVRVRVDVPSTEQRVLGGGVEHEERLAALPEDRERVAARGVEAAVARAGRGTRSRSPSTAARRPSACWPGR